MALTYDNTLRKAALDGIVALFNSGYFKLMTSGDAELAKPTFGATAFGAATEAAPSVATANALTKDESVTSGTIEKFSMQSSGSSDLLQGTVSTSSGDFVVTDNVIPETAVSVNVTGLTLSLTLGGS
jgi:type IV secretory pathway TrbL component